MAGGEQPLPRVPDVRFLEDLSGQMGNERLAAILGESDQIEQSVRDWRMLEERARDRIRTWNHTSSLHRHAKGELGDVAVVVGQQLDKIRNQRSLLDDTDHVGHRVTHLANAFARRCASCPTDLRQAWRPRPSGWTLIRFGRRWNRPHGKLFCERSDSRRPRLSGGHVRASL